MSSGTYSSSTYLSTKSQNWSATKTTSSSSSMLSQIPVKSIEPEDWRDAAEALGNFLQDELSCCPDIYTEDFIERLTTRIVEVVAQTIPGGLELVDTQKLLAKVVEQADLIQDLKIQIARPPSYEDFKNRPHYKEKSYNPKNHPEDYKSRTIIGGK